MKKLFYTITILGAALFAAISCQQKETLENPVCTVTDETDTPVLVLGQELEYPMDLAYFAYSKSADAANEVLKAPQFRVKSNCDWKLVPVGSAPEWMRPYPESGSKDGVFTFFLDRNNDAENPRSAIYKMVLMYDGQEKDVDGNIVITQGAAVNFLKVNVAKVEMNKEGGNASVTVSANVPWTYKLTPVEDYASPAIEEWITDKTELVEGAVSQTLKFKFADNSDGSIRAALLDIVVAGENDQLSKQLVMTQYGLDIEVVGFPVSWPGSAGNSSYPKWASASNAIPTIEATEGKGTITYVKADIPGLDRAASTTDCSGNNPRINGAWPGDYLEFNVPVAVSAGSLIKLQFEARISGSGCQHWRLEYKDGSEWRVAGTPLTTTLPADGVWPEEVITYTHDMAPGGSGDEFNQVISQVVRYENTTDEAAFRFYVASNVIASSGLRMEKPTTASARLDNSGGETGCDASISCVASGGEIKYADIEVSGLDKDYVLFDGTPKAPVKFKVVASDDFTVTTTADWLTVTQGAEGVADEETEVEVTCEQSTLSDPREASIIVQAGVTRKYISVIQSAAGQQLDAFISLSKGNFATVKHAGGEVKVKVQANVEFEMETSGEWITAIPANTKGLVEWTDVLVNVAENDSNGPRTGTVRFYNTEAGVETILNISQEYEEPIVENNLIQWGFSADLMAAYKEAFEQNNAFDANVEGKGTLSWHDLVENVAADTDAKKSHLIGGTGQPYVTGVFPGDYWQFTIPVVDVAAGTVVRFQGLHRVSGTGQKYWRMDWSLDGTNWTPVKELQTETETGTSAQYTHVAPTSDVLVDETFKLADGVTGKGSILIRFTCAANWQANGKGALAKPNGGTHRWSGAAENGPKITLDQPHDPLKAQWLFSAEAMADAETGYAATFGGTTAVNVKEAGDGGLYVNSNVTKGGKIRYFQVDKTVVDEDNKAARLVGGTGHPYVQGAWPGDYWLFEANDGYTYPAGTKVHIYFQTRLSATGHKYWKLEYWDGAAWQPVSALQETTVGTGEAAQTFQYNFEPSTDSKNNSVVDFTWTLAADCSNMQFRYTCMANWQANGKGALAKPNGGTCRIAGDATTSPVFEVVVED